MGSLDWPILRSRQGYWEVWKRASTSGREEKVFMAWRRPRMVNATLYCACFELFLLEL